MLMMITPTTTTTTLTHTTTMMPIKSSSTSTVHKVLGKPEKVFSYFFIQIMVYRVLLKCLGTLLG